MLLQVFVGRHDGVPRAALLGLHGEHHVGPAADRAANVVGTVAHHDHVAIDSPGVQRVEHVVEHRPSAHRHEHFGQIGLHTGALARRHDHCQGSTHKSTCSLNRAKWKATILATEPAAIQ